jgi:hypothetical protein
LGVEVLDCRLVIIYIYGLWNDWNICNMLYGGLEYDEYIFLKHKFENIDIIWFIIFFVMDLKITLKSLNFIKSIATSN